jgi:recombination protein RecT
MTTDRLRAVATGKPAKGDNPLVAFAGFMEKLKPQLALALPKHMNADRMARLALTAFSTNADLQNCTPTSIAGSIMTAAQLGLEPGINGQGYLIPYKGVCTFVPGWKGLVDLVSRSGRASVWTGVVRDGDEFSYQLGDAPYCRHVPGDDADDAEQFTHVYAVGRVRDATMAVIEVWSRSKVQRHLKQYNKVGTHHYALANENNFEMYARKVALLQVLKYMPASIELANAIEVSHAGESGAPVTLEGDLVRVGSIDDAPVGDGSDGAAEPVGVITPIPPDLAAAKLAIDEAGDAETAALVLDQQRGRMNDAQQKELAKHYRMRWTAKQ